jgi:hypothetical protein
MTFDLHAGEHRAHHIRLQKALDELVADFISNNHDKTLSGSSVIDLMNWSRAQAINPDHPLGADLDV